MKVYSPAMLEEYMKRDWILPELSRVHEGLSNQALLESPAKRMIWDDVYFSWWPNNMVSVTDIGGGWHSLHNVRKCAYTGVDLFDTPGQVGPYVVYDRHDWADGIPEADVIIANDVFPNMDQRLAQFLEMVLPRCSRLVITLTFFNKPHPGYRCRRVDGNETITVKPWSGADVLAVVGKYLTKPGAKDYFTSDAASPLWHQPISVFDNGRTVARVDLKGARWQSGC